MFMDTIKEIIFSMEPETNSVLYLNDETVRSVKRELDELDQDGANPFWTGIDQDPKWLKVMINTDATERCVVLVACGKEDFVS